MKESFGWLVLPILIGCITVSAFAQTYPSRPITIVVGGAAGGPTDIMGRLVAQMLTETLGQNTIVEDRPGAGNVTGTVYAAKAKPDGYTLSIASPSSHSIPPGLYPNLPYDPIKDFEPVSMVVTSTTALVVHPSLPARSLKEFIAFAKARPGQLNYASGGNGTVSHLTGELFKTMAGISLVHIPYKGLAPGVTALLSGEIAMAFNQLHLSLPYISSGRLRALGITSERRSALAPDVPTIAEAGVPGFRVNTWYGVMAPAGTPKAIVAQVSAALRKSLNDPKTKQRLAQQGLDAVGNTPEEFAVALRDDIQLWAKVIRESGAKVD